jgi:2-polyprenyl-3-methyl-5-hydroxy-6-metoxy-1,4-benzoquinol methylase
VNHFQDKKFLDSLYGQQDHIAFRGNFLKTYSNRKYSIRDIALRFVEQPHGKRILDIGAGTGSFLKKIMASSPDNNFAALDIAENAECRAIPNLDYRLFDGVHFPGNIGKWDIVILMHMLYHVPEHKPFLETVRQLLAKGGTVLITTKSKTTLPSKR